MSYHHLVALVQPAGADAHDALSRPRLRLPFLEDLRLGYGLTLVLVSHDLSVVRQMSDRVLFMTHAAVLDAVSRAVVATDTEGNILYWNRAAELLYGWTVDEVIGRHVLDVLAPLDDAGEAGETLGHVPRVFSRALWCS